VRFIDNRVTRVLPQAWHSIAARFSRWVSEPSGIDGPDARPRRRPRAGVGEEDVRVWALALT
jgi:hypothetical protein